MRLLYAHVRYVRVREPSGRRRVTALRARGLCYNIPVLPREIAYFNRLVGRLGQMSKFILKVIVF